MKGVERDQFRDPYTGLIRSTENLIEGSRRLSAFSMISDQGTCKDLDEGKLMIRRAQVGTLSQTDICGCMLIFGDGDDNAAVGEWRLL